MWDYFYRHHHHELFNDLFHLLQHTHDLSSLFHIQTPAIVDKQIEVEKNQLEY
jgi:hypothetical protein